jgi:hypothetical protein
VTGLDSIRYKLCYPATLKDEVKVFGRIKQTSHSHEAVYDAALPGVDEDTKVEEPEREFQEGR